MQMVTSLENTQQRDHLMKQEIHLPLRSAGKEMLIGIRWSNVPGSSWEARS